ncbi:hypothetical protein, partial [Schaalia canis]
MAALNKYAVRAIIFIACVSLLSACAYRDSEEIIVPHPILLTAQEAGGGEQIPISGGDLSVAADCGPDG